MVDVREENKVRSARTKADSEEVSLESTVKTLNQEIKASSDMQIWSVEKEASIQCADLCWDNNLLHRDSDYAVEYLKKRGIKAHDTPILGPLLALRAEQYALDILQKINNFRRTKGGEFYYVSNKINLPELAFPGDEIKLKFNKLRLLDRKERKIYTGKRYGDVLILDINAAKGMVKNYLIASFLFSTRKASLGYREKDHFSAQTDLSSMQFSKIEIRQEAFRTIDGTEIERPLEKLYRCMGVEPKQEIPPMWLPAFVSSSLLDVSKRIIGEPEGMIMSSSFRFYEKPEFGKFKVILLEPREPPKKKRGKERYFYEFETVAYHKRTELPLLRGEIRVVSGIKYTFD